MINKIEKFGEKWWGMAILSAIPVFIVLLPVLSGYYNFIEGESDRFQQDFYFYKDAILRGDSFFWNPYLLSGFPKFASLTGGYLNPLVYIGLKFFPVPFVYNWLNFLYLALAAFFTALFLKKININLLGCLVGGWIFVFSQWARNHDITMNSALFLLPLLFFLILEIKESRGWKTFLYVLAGSLAIGLIWVSSFWHLLIEIMVAAGAFSLFLAVRDFIHEKNEKKKKKNFFRAPLGYLSMVLGGTLIGLIQLVPTLVMISLSIRTTQFSHWDAVQGGIHFYDLIALVLPFFNYPFLARSSVLVEYWGVLPLFFVVVIFSLRGLKMPTFFSSLLLFGAVLAINGSPLFWAVHHLPVFNLLQTSSRWMLIVSFSAAILAALGLNAFFDEFEKLKSSWWLKITLQLYKWTGVLLSIASLVLSISYYFFKDKILSSLNSYFDKFIYAKTSHLSLNYYHDYINKLFSDFTLSFSPLNPKFLFPFVFLISAYFFLKFYKEGKFRESKKNIALAAALVAFNFICVYFFNDNIYKGYSLDNEPETVRFLRGQESGRIFSFFRYLAPLKLQNYGAYGMKQGEAELRSELLFPNKNLPFKIEGVDLEGDPMANKSMAKILSFLGAAASLPKAEKLENVPLSLEEKIKIFESRKPIIDFLGIRYLLSTGCIDENIFPKIFETEVTDKKIYVFIYKNKEARPLYYFTNEQWLIEVGGDITPEELNQKLKKFDYKISQKGIELLERKNAELTLKTNSDKEQLLVFSQNNLPGWKSFIDGKEIAIYSVGTVYMGIKVPAGQHQVGFEYSYWEIWRWFINNFF